MVHNTTSKYFIVSRAHTQSYGAKNTAPFHQNSSTFLQLWPNETETAHVLFEGGEYSSHVYLLHM